MVVVTGSLQGTTVMVRMTGLVKRQHLDVPPPVGGFHDTVTVTVSGASLSQPLTYLVGYADGTYEGIGTLDVGKHGNSGKIGVSAPAPEGQAPSIQSSGESVTSGGNGVSVIGTWRCP
jgi:hypothetical protein